MHPTDRKERDRLLRENDILNAAEHIFATKGYHNATISDIAKESQYAVGTIYLYFKGKPALYLTLIEKKAYEMISSTKKKVSQVKNSDDKIKILVQEQLAYFENNRDFFRIYFSERGGLRWTVKDKISKSAVDMFLKYVDYISELIEEDQKRNNIRKELNPKRAAYMLASMMNAIIFPWIRERSTGKENLEDLSKFVLDVFYKGVG